MMGGIYIILSAAYHFDGKCGGWMPFLSGPQDCSLFEYILSTVSFTILILLTYYWYWILSFLILATLTGYGIGLIKTKKIENNQRCPYDHDHVYLTMVLSTHLSALQDI